jgi:hypothetical protein
MNTSTPAAAGRSHVVELRHTDPRGESVVRAPLGNVANESMDSPVGHNSIQHTTSIDIGGSIVVTVRFITIPRRQMNWVNSRTISTAY